MAEVPSPDTEKWGRAITSIKRAGILAGITFLLLEAALQLLSLIAWASVPATARKAGERVVLCVGDSFTFGMGANHADGTYPAQLERILERETGQEWRVVNRGYPARNSREVLERIDGFLVTDRPEIVCVMIGVNDDWAKPKELVLPPMPPAEEVELVDEGFPIRFRVGRLIATFGSLNPWRGDDEQGEGALDSTAAQPDASTAPQTARQRLEQRLEAAAVGTFHEANLRTQLVRECRAMEDDDATQRYLARVRELFETKPDVHMTECYARALKASGDEAASATLAEASIDRYPKSGTLWYMVAKARIKRRDVPGAQTAIDRAITNLELEKNRTQHAYRLKAQIYKKLDPDVVVDSLVRMYLDARNVQMARLSFRVYRELADLEKYRAKCEELGLDAATTADVLAIRKGAAPTTVPVEQNPVRLTMVSHLKQIVTRARSRNAEVIFGRYPWRGNRSYHHAMDDVSKTLGVPSIGDLKSRFDAAKKANPGVPLLAHDGHCADAGYGIMAKAFAEQIESIEARKAGAAQPAKPR